MKAKALTLSLSLLLFSCETTYKIETVPVKPANPVEMSGSLKTAFKTGKLNKVSKVLSNNPHLIFSVDKNGQTPLHLSAQRGLLDISKYLVKYGADLEVKDNQGRTPLHLALFAGQSATVKFFVKSGVKLDEKDNFGNTALHFAAQFYKSAEIFTILDRAGVKLDINESNSIGQTALHIAAKENNKAFVRALLARNAKVDIIDQRGNTALMNAAESPKKNDDLCMELVKAGSPLKTVNKEQNNLLIFSVRRNKQKLFFKVLDQFPKFDSKNLQGFTALHLAVQESNYSLAKVLLDKGANINSQDKEGNSILHSLAFWGNAEGAKFLLAYKPKLNLVNDEKTPACS